MFIWTCIETSCRFPLLVASPAGCSQATLFMNWFNLLFAQTAAGFAAQCMDGLPGGLCA